MTDEEALRTCKANLELATLRNVAHIQADDMCRALVIAELRVSQLYETLQKIRRMEGRDENGGRG